MPTEEAQCSIVSAKLEDNAKFTADPSSNVACLIYFANLINDVIWNAL